MLPEMLGVRAKITVQATSVFPQQNLGGGSLHDGV